MGFAGALAGRFCSLSGIISTFRFYGKTLDLQIAKGITSLSSSSVAPYRHHVPASHPQLLVPVGMEVNRRVGLGDMLLICC